MRILIVEDEKRLAERWRSCCTGGATPWMSAMTACPALTTPAADLTIWCCWTLCCRSWTAFSLLQQLRAGGETVPVLMLTARSDLSDRVGSGLRRGLLPDQAL